MNLKNIFSLFTFSLVWYVQLFTISLKVSYEKFIQKLATLPLISMNFSIGYFILVLVQQSRPNKISKKFLDTLFMVVFSLTVFSISTQWYLNSIDPELTQGEILDTDSKEYYCGMFLYGGNLVLIIWYGLNLESYSKVSLKVIIYFIFGFFLWYTGILIGTKIVTGKFPYNFISKFSLADYIRLILTQLGINILSIIGFRNLVKWQIKLKIQ